MSTGQGNAVMRDAVLLSSRDGGKNLCVTAGVNLRAVKPSRVMDARSFVENLFAEVLVTLLNPDLHCKDVSGV